MTVLIGIRCTDGIVIGSDSAHTSGTADGRPTTVHPGTKIDIIQNSVILAHTGQVGMAQRFHDVVARGWEKNDFKGKTSLDMARHMSALARRDFGETMANQNVYGSLVGFRSSKDGHALCEFAVADFQPELKTETWYCSMGSGQSVVDPLLGLFRKAFWADGPPKLAEGIFAATWALELALELCPAFVAGPIKLAKLENNKATFLDDEELDSHRQNAEQAIVYFGEYADSFDDSDQTVPKPATKNNGDS